MSSKDAQIRDRIAEQASEWFAAHDAGLLDAERSAALVEWLRASPLNVEEFLGVAAIARDLHMDDAHPEASLEALLARAAADEKDSVPTFWSRVFVSPGGTSWRRWQSAVLGAAAMAVAALGVWLWHLRPVTRVTAASTAVAALRFETRHGEQKTYRLADNTLLHLNTDTAVTVRYSQSQRLVALSSGEAAFEVTHEPRRPFRVLAGPAEVVDAGTNFDVRLRLNSVVVTVVDGRVAVEPSTPQKTGTSLRLNQRLRPLHLGANQQVTVADGAWPLTPVSVDAQRATSWLHRQIEFENEPLERVAAEFNRYAAKPIEIAAPKLRQLQISGVFSTDDPEELIAFLRSLEGVRVDVTPTSIRVSQK
ncbi:MAG: FecR domain-containing protein [Sinobacteraceae bacterium]|nr:FecR domain-containing protein [Nevskiaceae bacterium]